MLVVRHVGTARLDTLVSTRSTGSTRSKKSNVSNRVESSRDEPSGIWAFIFLYNGPVAISCDSGTLNIYCRNNNNNNNNHHSLHVEKIAELVAPLIAAKVYKVQH